MPLASEAETAEETAGQFAVELASETAGQFVELDAETPGQFVEPAAETTGQFAGTSELEGSEADYSTVEQHDRPHKLPKSEPNTNFQPLFNS